MAVQDQWLRASQQRLEFAKSLWQDLSFHYGDTGNAQYWRQRPARMAYQYAIVDHLLGAAKYLAQASLKQLANTRFDDITLLTWVDVEALLVRQKYLSPEAQHILVLLQQGEWSVWIKLQAQTDFSVLSKPTEQPEGLILTKSDDLTNPDYWPVASWLTQLQSLQSSIQNSMEEW